MLLAALRVLLAALGQTPTYLGTTWLGVVVSFIPAAITLLVIAIRDGIKSVIHHFVKNFAWVFTVLFATWLLIFAYSICNVIYDHVAVLTRSVDSLRVELKSTKDAGKIVDEDHIYQGGIVVGKVVGGRRSPEDATLFEFEEIDDCRQFNTTQPFTYEGIDLIYIKDQDDALIDIARPADSPIRWGVSARVVTSSPS